MSQRTITSKAFRNLIIEGARNSEPVDPRCPHAQTCGGCAFQDCAYHAQVAVKTEAIRQLWSGFEPAILLPHPADELEIIPSPQPYNYRTRMDYVATKGRFGLRMRGRFNFIIDLETCHLIPPAAFDVAHMLWRRSQELGLPDYNIRTHEGFLRYLVIRRSPQEIEPGISPILVAAVTAAGDYAAEMEQLASLALEQPGVIGFHWLLNDTLTDLSTGEPVHHWGATTLPMQPAAGRYGESPVLHIGPNTFFQNNVHLMMPLFDTVVDAVMPLWHGSVPDDTPEDTPNNRVLRVADLYSGVGAIALYLAQALTNRASETTAPYHIFSVESNAESAALARYNVSVNQIRNVVVMAEDVLAFLQRQAMNHFDVVILDPPRTGLGEKTCVALLRLLPRRIIYVSCNPLTQFDDLRYLSLAYHLTMLRGYDMFPHTPHLEMLAVLDRIPTWSRH
jgi:tRNA/tmRNA/rRNA uracil-C5-methylase (TrmA/RlmC/RlmD family)